MRPLRASGVPLLLAALALACYLPGISWGILHANRPDRTRGWAVDDEVPLGSLSAVREILRGPVPDRNLGYPLGHSLAVASASAPYMGVLVATGEFRADTSEYPYGFRDPVRSIRILSIFGRLVSVALAVAAVLAAWFAARELWGARAGVLAGIMTATSFPMFYYSRTGNVDMAQLGWMACALAAAARIMAAGVTVKRAAWLGIFVGAAVGTKESIVAAFLTVPAVLLAFQWLDHRAGRSTVRRWWLPSLAAAVTAFPSFGLFSGLLLDSERYLAHIDFIRSRLTDAATGNVAFVQAYPWTIEGHLGFAGVLTGLISNILTWPGLLLALIGVALAVRRRARGAWFILPAVTYLAVLFVTARIGQMRYVMPAAWVLAGFAAYAVASAWESRQAVVRWAGLAGATVMIGLNLGRGIDLTHAMLHDSRHAAAEWFAANAAEGNRVAFFGSDQKLPVLAPTVQVERPGEYLGANVAVAADAEEARRIAERWKANPPDFVLLIPDHSSRPGVPYPASCPPALVDALESGELGYRRVAFFETPRLLPWIGRPPLDYPTVNPPTRVYRRVAR